MTKARLCYLMPILGARKPCRPHTGPHPLGRITGFRRNHQFPFING